MKNTLRLEEGFMLLLSMYLYQFTGYSWWWYFGLFLAPDISMAGYLHNEKTGAFIYNLAHSKAIAIIIYLVGIYFTLPACKIAGLILFGHSSFDRMLGYGLKFPDSFQHTHLGMIGKVTKTE